MFNLELVLNMLAEASTTEISKHQQPDTFEKSKGIAKAWWSVASTARKELESKTWKSVVTSNTPKKALPTDSTP